MQEEVETLKTVTYTIYTIAENWSSLSFMSGEGIGWAVQSWLVKQMEKELVNLIHQQVCEEKILVSGASTRPKQSKAVFL